MLVLSSKNLILKVPKIDGVGEDRNVKPVCLITSEEMLINGYCTRKHFIRRKGIKELNLASLKKFIRANSVTL